MTKILYLLCLSAIKFILIKLTLGSEIKSPNIVNKSLSMKFHNTKNGKDDSTFSKFGDKCDDEFSKDIQSDDSESSEILPVDDLLGMLQNEMDKSEDVEKTKYLDFLTSLYEALKQDVQKVNVFFKNSWKTVDLGLRGSSQRQRSTTKAKGMLQYLKDLWAWLWRRVFSLTTWFKPDGSEKEVNHLNKIDHNEKVKLLERHSADREVYYATNSAKNEINGSKAKGLK